MSLLKIALLIQVIGFFIGTLSLALLKINTVKRLAEGIKAAINRKATPDMKTLLIDSMVKAGFTAIIYLELQSASKRPEGLNNWRFTVYRLKKLFSVVLPVTCLAIFFLIYNFLNRLLEGLAKKLSGAEVITNIAFIFGALLLFVGLIMEFIVAA